MEILQWLSTALRAVTAGLFALLPGMVFWLTVLGFYMLIQWVGQSQFSRTLKGRTWSARHTPRQISQGKG
jgi:hypothetical protein